MAWAAGQYIRDLSEYLTSGNLSDLTLKFGEKIWQIHKAITCSHSKWFHRAVTIGFEESKSGVITLRDDPEFAHAIECMVSYFYKAGYNASEYDISEPLLHAQVVIIADKYDCASLYNLARKSFANTVKSLKNDDWAAVAALVYNHTTTEVPAHVELRDLVIAAVAGPHSGLNLILQNQSVEELLRSNADLATDLLLHRFKAIDNPEYIFVCDSCHYVHTGSRNCSMVALESGSKRVCINCYSKGDVISSITCPNCDGIQTQPNEGSESKSED